MKKLMIVAIAGLFFFASCGNKAKETAVVEPVQQEECQNADKPCCKEMTEEQKADMEAWKNWDNQTAEKKQELLNKRKENIDKAMAEMNAQGEVPVEFTEFQTKWNNWGNLSVDEQKTLVEEFKGNCASKCGKDKACCKEGENKEGCTAHQHNS